MADFDAPAVLDAPAGATDLGDAVETEDSDVPQDDTPGDDTGADDAPAEGDTSDEDAESEGDKDPVAADGRKMPDSLKKALAAVKATNPEAAKELRGIYFANQEYRNSFPTAAEAATAKTLIEEVGGPEGVQEIAAEREEWGTLDKQYEEGSGDFIKSIAESNPEAFVKIAPHAINEWASRAPEQYAYYAQSLTVNMLKNAGIPDKLSEAYHAAANNPQLQAQIAGVYNSIVDMHDKAQQFAQKRVDPHEEQLNKREQQFEQRRRADFEDGVASKAETYLAGKMISEMKIVIGNRKTDPEAMPHYEKLVKDEVERRMVEIPGFEGKLEAFYRTGDAKKSLDFITGHYNRILPEAAKVIAPLVRNIGNVPAPKAKPAQNGAPAIRSEVTLKEMPEWKDIDFAKCTTADVASGWAILKSGKKASGWL